MTDRTTLHERRFEEVECHPISSEDQSRVHRFGGKVFTWNVPRMCIVRGGNSSIRLSCNTSKFVYLVLVTSIYFSGRGMSLHSSRGAELEVRRDDDK